MELDELKQTWTESLPGMGPEESQPGNAGKEVYALFSRPSRSALNFMKKNLEREMITVGILYAALVAFFIFLRGGWLAEISYSYLAIGIAFLLFYGFMRRLISAMETPGWKMLGHLRSQCRLLKKYMNVYLWFGTAVFPATLLFITWLMDQKLPPVLNRPFHSPAWFIFIALVTIIMFLVNRYSIRRQYGEHLSRLQSLLMELMADS